MIDRVCKIEFSLGRVLSQPLTGGEEISDRTTSVHFLDLRWAQILSTEERPGGIGLCSLEKRKIAGYTEDSRKPQVAQPSELSTSSLHLTHAGSPGTRSKMHKASLTGTGSSAVRVLSSPCL